MLGLALIAMSLVALAGALPLATGCNFVRQQDGRILPGSELATDNGAKGDSTRAGAALAEGEWVQRIVPAGGDDSAAPRGRWRHAGLETVLAEPDARVQLRKLFRSRDAKVAANAAIGLAWLGDSAVLPALVKSARDATAKLPARGAAIEAIGRLDDDALEKLLADYGDFKGAARSRYLPDLHADLIRAMAARPSSLHGDALQKALASPAAAVRLEAAQAYLHGGRAVPDDLVNGTADDSAAVRAAAVRALAAAQHQQAQACVWRALTDYDLMVRLAAIEALGVLPAPENAERLHALATDSADVIRAAAVKALGRRGETKAIARAAKDASWRVRSAAADSLLLMPAAERQPLARALLEDASLEVQRRMVRALAHWPLEESIGLLLTAIEGPTTATRREAVAQLQARWPQAAELSPSAPVERLTAEVARLRGLWQRRLADEGRTEDSIAAEGRRAVSETALDAATLRRLHETIGQLAAESVHDRRAAAQKLAIEHREIALPLAALARLRELVEHEVDSLVWFELWPLVAADSRAPAADIAATAASLPNAELRRRACAYFAAHPSPRAIEVLQNCLSDEDTSVMREALSSLAVQHDTPNLELIESLLAAADSSVRIEAAVVLARHGSPVGMRALLRLAHHQDPAVRRRAARGLGEAFTDSPTARLDGNLADGPRQPRVAYNDATRNEVITELVRLLDDKHVCGNALASLAEIVGDPPGSESGTADVDDLARRWKEWHRARQ